VPIVLQILPREDQGQLFFEAHIAPAGG
jgi:hypothetical protein